MQWKGRVEDMKLYLVPYQEEYPIPDHEVRRLVRERLQKLYRNVRDQDKRCVPSDEVVAAVMEYAADTGTPFWCDASSDVLDGKEVPLFVSKFLGLGLIERTLSETKGWKF